MACHPPKFCALPSESEHVFCQVGRQWQSSDMHDRGRLFKKTRADLCKLTQQHTSGTHSHSLPTGADLSLILISRVSWGSGSFEFDTLRAISPIQISFPAYEPSFLARVRAPLPQSFFLQPGDLDFLTS